MQYKKTTGGVQMGRTWKRICTSYLIRSRGVHSHDGTQVTGRKETGRLERRLARHGWHCLYGQARQQCHQAHLPVWCYCKQRRQRWYRHSGFYVPAAAPDFPSERCPLSAPLPPPLPPGAMGDRI
jgi:hypothetical protein